MFTNSCFDRYSTGHCSLFTKQSTARPCNIQTAGKGMFLYSAVSSHWDCSERFTLHPLADLFLYTSTPGRPVPLHFIPWQTCSLQHQLDFSRKHSAMLQLLHKDYSFTHISLSVASKRNWVRNGSKRIQNQVLSIESPMFLPQRHEIGFETRFCRLRVQCSYHNATAHHSSLLNLHFRQLVMTSGLCIHNMITLFIQREHILSKILPQLIFSTCLALKSIHQISNPSSIHYDVLAHYLVLMKSPDN